MTDGDVINVQIRVYREIVAWMFIVGLALAVSPISRFGHTWSVVVSAPGGPKWFAAGYLICGVVLGWALRRRRDKVMGWALLAGGMVNWFLGIFLLLGAVVGPTGVLGAPFALYVGRHMLIHSALFVRPDPIYRLQQKFTAWRERRKPSS